MSKMITVNGVEMEDRREMHPKDIIIPVIVSMIVGVGGSFISTSITLATVTTEVKTMKEDIADLKTIFIAVQQNQIELASRGQWIRNTEEKLASLQKEADRNRVSIERILASMTTKEEAQADKADLLQKIKDSKQ